ncbi:MAG: tRNA lysidine(34) synthetase TilS [Candidatus Rokubacteria bacterium]|nr:tRNA lysidine(34) synthetase TilS [Candidatus Rokubacteria bacterium]
MSLADLVRPALRRHAMLAGGERVLVGVSGGADSVALLAALVEVAAALRLELHVLHVDHQLRPDSARDGVFVAALGRRLGVPVTVERVDVPPGGSLEAAARGARHAALEAVAARVGATRIALGHTADDQAETVLMRLLEGAGVRGLAAIPPVRGRIIRPLIGTRRGEIEAALRAAGLAWVEDPTNRDPKFLRNRMRHEVLPLLASTYDGDVVPALARVAALAREATDALDELAGRELERLASREADGALTLSVAALRALPAYVAPDVLRQAAARLGGTAPLRAWAHRGLARVTAAPPVRRAFRLGGVVVEVSADRVRLGRGLPSPLARRALSVPARVELPEIRRALEATIVDADSYRIPAGAAVVAFDADLLPSTLVVRSRRRGDRLTAFGGGERRLKSLLITAKVPRWDRARVPLVEAAGTILWVAGLRRSAEAPVTPATRRILQLALLPLPPAR